MKLSDFDKMTKLTPEDSIGKTITVPGALNPIDNSPMYFKITQAKNIYNRAMLYLEDNNGLSFVVSYSEFEQALKDSYNITVLK